MKTSMMIVNYFILLLAAACKTDNPPVNSKTGYNLSEYSKKFKLPGKLNEVSGLSSFSAGSIACVQDEEGKMYIYNLKNEEVEETIGFGKKGDYEGIAIADEDAFVLRSDGALFQVKNWKTEDRETIEFKTFLSEKNDAEGICYDPGGHRLLIACKGRAGEGDSFKGKKAIYSFDLSLRKLSEVPAFLISLQQIRDSLKLAGLNESYERLTEFLGEPEGSLTFQPSGIAIHPFSGHIYVISSAGKLLVVLNQNGKIEHIEKMNCKYFKQPEGITFLPDGDMLISNEGQGGDADILLFKYGK